MPGRHDRLTRRLTRHTVIALSVSGPDGTMLTVSRRQAHAWRTRRHLLDPLGDLPVPATVERLCGVQAQVASAAELAVALRSERPVAGAVAEALKEGRIIKTWAMRGALHLLGPHQGAAFLALIAHARPWERPSCNACSG